MRTIDQLKKMLWDSANEDCTPIRVTTQEWKRVLWNYEDEFICGGRTYHAHSISLGFGVVQVTPVKLYKEQA